MKAVLFDFGGTIDTDGVHWSEKYWEWYQRFGIAVPKITFEQAFVQSEAELLKDNGISTATFYRILEKQLTLQFRILRIEKQKNILQPMVDGCYEETQQTISRARNVIERLRPRYVLGVVSNFYGNLEIVCKEFRLDTLFEAKIDSRVVGLRKPDPAIFQLALHQLRALPSDAYVVGDSYERDIVPSKMIGCTTIWLKGKSWMMPSSTTAADHTVGRFEEITGILS